jgi:hypothetical protein
MSNVFMLKEEKYLVVEQSILSGPVTRLELLADGLFFKQLLSPWINIPYFEEYLHMIIIKIRTKRKMSMVVECRLKLHLLEEIIKRRLVILESSVAVADLVPDTGSGLFSIPDTRTRTQMSRIRNTGASSGGRWVGGWSYNPPPPCPASTFPLNQLMTTFALASLSMAEGAFTWNLRLCATTVERREPWPRVVTAQPATW